MLRPVHQEPHQSDGRDAVSAAPRTLPRPRRVLIIEDDAQAGRQLQRLLEEDLRLDVTVLTDPAQAVPMLSVPPSYSLMLTDLRMTAVGGLDLVREIQRLRLPVTPIVMTAPGGVDEAVRSIRFGAYDFLPKPVDPDRLRSLVMRALTEHAARDEMTALRDQLQSRYRFNNVLSQSPRMHEIFDLVSRVGQTGATVLIEGETGTGKEQLARAVHAASLARGGPMVALNCAAIPENLLESELFGHEKGAFTSAVAQRKGRFEMAHQGTLFLDEIGEMTLPMQVKLLRVLQERSFERVGSGQRMDVDVRIVAATNQPLKRLVKERRFREDLYYRLNVVRITVPPLRERLEDVPLLVAHFAERYAAPGQSPRRFSEAALEQLLLHRWPGNIRELENVVERVCITCRDEVIGLEHLPPELLAHVAAHGPASEPVVPVDLNRPLRTILKEMTATVERQYILKALKKTRGHVARAAELCGYSRRSITAKIAEYSLDRSEFVRS